MFTRVLACSDGSEHAIKAAGIAVEICRAAGASLTLLHVFELPPIAVSMADGFALDPTLCGPVPEYVQNEIVKRTVSGIAESGVPFNDLRGTGYSAAEVITRVAEEEKIDLIVMGSRGLGTFTSILLGSVSNAVAHHAHCGLLIVK